MDYRMGIFINNDNDKEKINIEKILPNDDILIDDYSFKDEDEFDEAINGDEDNEMALKTKYTR